ncbi:MAG: acyl-CoA acyltransferase [Sulfurimonadaceae bacterium]|nr:acyl-CoA acyltransferase [Sulfurimonadaceae bacterium]
MILQSTRAGKKFGIFDFIFKTKEDAKTLACLEKMTVTQAKSQCHYSNFLIAEADGVSVGSLCSYEPRIATKEVFIEAINQTECVSIALEDLDILHECDFHLNNRTLMFDYLEEIKGFEDVGILKALMQKSLLTARLKGYRIAQTIVEIGSLEIILDYKKLGFKVTQEKECELYKEEFGRIGLALMSIEF